MIISCIYEVWMHHVLSYFFYHRLDYLMMSLFSFTIFFPFSEVPTLNRVHFKNYFIFFSFLFPFGDLKDAFNHVSLSV